MKKASCRLGVEMLEDRTVLTLLGNQVFPLNNPWNQKITSAPVAANSAALMANFVKLEGNSQVRADFSQDDYSHAPLYGIPYNVVHGNTTPKISVVIDDYASESDIVPAPIPANAVLEGDFRDGPNFGKVNRGDSHLLIYDEDNNIAYEFFSTSRPSENPDGKWHAKQETVWNFKTNQFRTLGHTSADAAGLSILAGLARPDEGKPVNQGGQGAIKHALRVTLQNNVILNQFVYPASHVANPGNTDASLLIPMGTRLRLKASVNLSKMPSESRIIAQAMKDYGLIVADNGANFFISGASDAINAAGKPFLTWNDADIQNDVIGLKSLRATDFEIVDLTPRVTAVSVSQGAPGSTVTITGLNFSGNAGLLTVYFGTIASPSVTYIDDRHVRAVVPAGVTGSVHIRVQLGKTTNQATSENIKGSLFGYGISEATPADLFTVLKQRLRF